VNTRERKFSCWTGRALKNSFGVYCCCSAVASPWLELLAALAWRGWIVKPWGAGNPVAGVVDCALGTLVNYFPDRSHQANTATAAAFLPLLALWASGPGTIFTVAVTVSCAILPAVPS